MPRPSQRTVVVKNAVRRYGKVLALDHVEMSAASGEFTVIAGPSGSGKSTLLHLIACLDRPDEGTVSIGDIDVNLLPASARRQMRRRAIGIVLPQPSDNLLDGPTVAGNVAYCAGLRRLPLDLHTTLNRIGLEGSESKRVTELSGGEQQRLAVALATLGNPSVVVADEPTASLDLDNGRTVTRLLKDVAAAGATVIVASHDLAVVEAADQLVHLDHGRNT